MSFQRYLLRRILFIIPVCFGITLFAFVIANAVPADPITANLPQSALNNQEIIDAFRQRWGLDQPLHVQYLTYVGNLLRGDLGTSIKTRQPVAEDIGKFLPATIELATVGILFGIGMGVAFGIISAVWRNSLIDYIVRVFSLVGVSFPVFVLALIGLTVLHAQLGWVPGPGRLAVLLDDPPYVTGLFTIDSLLAGQWDVFRDALSRLLLPGFVLGAYVSGIIARITRSSLLNVIGLDYMRTARSKGLRESWAIWRHALPNALIPVVTVIGLSYSNLLSGAVLTESIFAWPGIGRYMFRASTSQDFPAIMGGSIIIALIYVGVNFIVDILYYFIDPRIRLA
ncbi:MAG: ABC transporter permease [Chloroflexota bacterium]|nr:ABC transporter permease [Chloroflexota bacterium]